MEITIIGWYGTETIGDRAILAGLISILNKSYTNFEINLGSLYPFFSERTLSEDYKFYEAICGKKIKIQLFNSKKSNELKEVIRKSNLVVMGGGPLMDISELFMIEYAFKIAKKYNKKTAILGCGIGPLCIKKYRKSVLEISLNSDITILRDFNSKKELAKIYDEFGQVFDSHLIQTNFDLSVESLIHFKKKYEKKNKSYIAVNLRDFPMDYSHVLNRSIKINDNLQKFVSDLTEKFIDRDIHLIPMHYFHIGNDDRLFLNKIELNIKRKNIIVQNENLTLEETMSFYGDSFLNIGMRFHSVVFQTILSGNNFILDYTEPHIGKISSFLQDAKILDIYKDRYISLQNDDPKIDMINNFVNRFKFNDSLVEKKLYKYVEIIKSNESPDC